jgi:hypothetical protein
MSAPAECPGTPFERYGLQLVEEPARAEPAPHPVATPSRPRSTLDRFHWTLLIGFGVLQLTYLFGLVRIARWALYHLLRS